MTMKFIDVKDELVTYLGTKAAGRFNVIGYNAYPKAAEAYEGDNRTARVVYNGGRFPKGAGTLATPAKHLVSMRIEMICTANGTMDLSVFDDPDATEEEKRTALAGATPAAEIVDQSFDEFASILWEILMAPEGRWLGSTKYVVGSRWVEEIQKDRLIPQGQSAILLGAVVLSFDIEEKAPGKATFPVNYIGGQFTPINGDSVQETNADIDLTEE